MHISLIQFIATWLRLARLPFALFSLARISSICAGFARGAMARFLPSNPRACMLGSVGLCSILLAFAPVDVAAQAAVSDTRGFNRPSIPPELRVPPLLPRRVVTGSLTAETGTMTVTQPISATAPVTATDSITGTEVPTHTSAVTGTGPVTATMTDALTETENLTETEDLAVLLPTPTPVDWSAETVEPADTEAASTPEPTPTITPIAEPDLPDTPQGEAIAAAVNLRGGPGTNYPVQGQVRSNGPAFEIVGRTETGDWLQVCCPANPQEPVWISGDLVAVTLPEDMGLAALPVPEIPPTPVPTPTPDAPPAASGGPSQSATDLAAAPAAGLPGPGNFGAPGGTNPLTGQPLPGGRAGQRPLVVCINNDFAARPQVGTSQADVMYEYLMEGMGITRMSGVYYGTDAGQIGPVRSARLINYYLGALYDGGLACTGASDPVRYVLKHEAPFPYLDFDLDDPNATRYSSSVGTDYRTRMRTSSSGLRAWLADWGVEGAPSLRGFTFGELPGGGAPATSLAIPYPAGTGSQVAYQFSNGRYLRSMGGGAHVDGGSGSQLAYENVVVQYVAHQATDIVEDSLGSTSIRLNLFGSNRAIVFRDGQAFEGTWRSDSRGDLPRFYDANGTEIPLKPGRTFFSIVPGSYTITYQ